MPKPHEFLSAEQREGHFPEGAVDSEFYAEGILKTYFIFSGDVL